MSDYYKTNTVGLPSCMRASNLNLTNFLKVSVNLFMPAIHNPRFKNATHVYVSTGLSIYERKFFCKMKLLSLTWCRQIEYLISTYLPNFKHINSNNITKFIYTSLSTSMNVLLKNKINAIKVNKYEI